MANIYQFNQTEIIAFFLVLLRLSAFFVAWPIFSAANVPSSIKILFALVVSIAVFPIVSYEQVQVDFESVQLAWLCIREVFIGVTLGFFAKCSFLYFLFQGKLLV